jgi:Flp pilus assembly pilin Flp
MKYLWNFLKEEEGQDLIEYSMLLAFVVIGSAALYLGAGRNVKGVWTTANSQLITANTNAS